MNTIPQRNWLAFLILGVWLVPACVPLQAQPLSVSTIAGPAGFSQGANGIAIDSSGTIFYVDGGNVRKLVLGNAVVITSAAFNTFASIAVATNGVIYLTDAVNNTIHKVTTNGVLTTIAGQNAKSGSVNGVGTNALFSSPSGIAVDTVGNLYVADKDNDAIRKLASDGSVTTFIGSSSLFQPSAVAVDAMGIVYIADSGDNRVLIATPAGVLSLVASLDAPNTSTWYPSGITVDPVGNIYVVDNVQSTIKKITPSGNVTIVAGQLYHPGYTDGVGSDALLNFPNGIAADGAGNVYFPDGANYNSYIRKGTPSRLGQTISFGALTGRQVGDPPFNLNATASSGLPVSYSSSNPGVATISGSTVTVIGAGTTTITASQGGDTTYLPATRVSQTLTVFVAPAPPSISTLPSSQTVKVGQNVSFSVAATGIGPFGYQWRKNGTNLAGATGAVLSLGIAQTNQAGSQSGSYTVVVSNGAGSITSAPPAMLTVNPAASGTVVAWGDSRSGQTFVPVAAASGVIAIAAGGAHTVVLKNNGKVVAWGAGTAYLPFPSDPHWGQSVVPPELTEVTAIAAGFRHTVALKNDGSVRAWGSGTANSPADYFDFGQSIVPPGLTGVTVVAAGGYHTMALERVLK